MKGVGMGAAWITTALATAACGPLVAQEEGSELAERVERGEQIGTGQTGFLRCRTEIDFLEDGWIDEVVVYTYDESGFLVRADYDVDYRGHADRGRVVETLVGHLNDWPGGAWSFAVTYENDAAGRPVAMDGPDRLTRDPVAEYWEYDERGRVVRHSRDDDADGEINGVDEYEYDGDLLAAYIERWRPSSPGMRTEYSYDAEGRILREYRFEVSSGWPWSITEYQYEYPEPNQIVERLIDGYSDELFGETRTVLGVDGQPVLVESFVEPEHEPIGRTSYTYDHGRLVSERYEDFVFYDSDGRLDPTRTTPKLTRHFYAETCPGAAAAAGDGSGP